MGVPKRYICLLAALYSDQVAVVKTDVCSKPFSIERGTKQGDPLSPIIFNAVLERAMAAIQEKWRHKGYGIDLGLGRSKALCNLRFADDILIWAQSRTHLEDMLKDIAEST
eukprot:3353626-Karenia_brevis.AAC.1